MERIRILLGLEQIEDDISRLQRQQITPDINFTCDGLITKWIVGARWMSDDYRFPELQIWRRVGNESNVYKKINGTFLNIDIESDNDIYEYDNFSPIPFRAGDILGIFAPRYLQSRLRIRAEDTNSPLNYYIPVANSARVSPVDIIDLERTETLESAQYRHLVSVHIDIQYLSTSSKGQSQTIQ